VTRAPNVLYLPDSHIQIVDATLVPVEANPDGGFALFIMQECARKQEIRDSYLRSEFGYG
jgi:hypothetical protein